MLCKRCRYPLDGLTTPRCPECGTAFDARDPETYRESTPAAGTPPQHAMCESCGYDLVGNETGICPECGMRFGRPAPAQGEPPRSSRTLRDVLRRLRR